MSQELHVINYPALVARAMQSVIVDALSVVEQHGLPADSYFVINFDTRHPDIKMDESLVEKYPDNMTIVIQHWYDGLAVSENGFAITLNFSERHLELFIPFDSIKTFMDPGAQFSLTCQQNGTDSHKKVSSAKEDEAAPSPRDRIGSAPAEDVDETKVVSIDRFRRK